MKTKILAALLAIGTLAGGASADFIGVGFAIPDNNATGASSNIVITDPGTVLPGLVVSITFGNPGHTWAGDLIGTLSHNNGLNTVTIDLFRRMGKLTLSTTDFGNPNDLDGTYRFSDVFSSVYWNPPTQIPGPTIVPGDYRPTSNFFNGSPGPIVSIDSAFVGRDLAGTWTLRISDNAAGDTGNVESWSLGYIPAPAGLALLGLAALRGTRRRRAS